MITLQKVLETINVSNNVETIITKITTLGFYNNLKSLEEDLSKFTSEIAINEEEYQTLLHFDVITIGNQKTRFKIIYN